MAAVTCTVEAMTANTKSTDVVTGANMTSCTTSDTMTLTPPANRMEDIVLICAFGTSSTLTINAGANPPSSKAGLGSLAVTGTTSEVRIIPLDYERFAQSDGTITMTVAGNTCKIGAFRIPRTI